MSFLEKFIAFFTIVRREWVRTFRIWAGTLLPPAITTILYFIIFGHVIGSRVGDIDGYPYLLFIAPGLIMMSVITNAYACSVSAFFGSKFQRDLEEMLVSPMPEWVMLSGFMVAGMVRGILVGIIVTIIALLFTHLTVHSILIIIGVALLTAAIFSLAGVLNAIYANSFDDISLVPTFVLTPLTYLGGVFYSISMLPVVWQYISLVNPIVYIIHSFRYGILGTDADYLWQSFIAMIFVVIALFLLALYLIKKGVRIRT
jgi:ABC-2 type transport system permease protein